MLAGLFGQTVGPDDVEVFPFELAAASVLTPHRHTSDLAAWVTEGRMAFGFGDDYGERVELGPGDMIWLQAARRTRRKSSGGTRVDGGRVHHVASRPSLPDGGSARPPGVAGTSMSGDTASGRARTCSPNVDELADEIAGPGSDRRRTGGPPAPASPNRVRRIGLSMDAHARGPSMRRSSRSTCPGPSRGHWDDARADGSSCWDGRGATRSAGPSRRTARAADGSGWRPAR